MPKKEKQWIFDTTITYDRRCFAKIEEQGFKIGIGVATGADAVFIGKDLKGKVEDDLLIPIVLSRDIECEEIRWSGNYILNPFSKGGNNAIRLDDYPMAKRYLRDSADRNLSVLYSKSASISSRSPFSILPLIPPSSSELGIMVRWGWREFHLFILWRP